MSITPMFQEFLRTANVPYTVVPHATAITAAEEAAVTHTPADRWAKTVACFADHRPVLAVVPADCFVDLEQLGDVLRVDDVRLAHEDELEWLYPDCETGAMPPFGGLYHQRVVLDTALALEPVVVFHAGTHRDAVRMHTRDFLALAQPIVGPFAALPPGA